MTLIQEKKNVEKISMVKPTEAQGGGAHTDFVCCLFDFHFAI